MGLTYGLLLGLTRMILSFVYTNPLCGEPDTRPWVVGGVHYMYFAMFSFFSTGLLMIGVSFCAPRPSAMRLRGLTFWTRFQPVADEQTPTSLETLGGDDATRTDHGTLSASGDAPKRLWESELICICS